MTIPEGFQVVGRERNQLPEGFQQVSPKINKTLQFAQKLAQGATFGFGDEISAAMVGAMSKLTGGEFKDAYDFSLKRIRSQEEEFSKQNPKMALGAELAGALVTGGMAGAKALNPKVLESASAAGKYGRIAAVGGAEGALYGAGTGADDRGERALTGLLIGAAAAPVGAKVIDLAVRGIGTTASYAGRKLGDTPKDQAVRALRSAAEAEGIDADDALRILDDLGPNATLADLGENFRLLARGATDQAGGFKASATSAMNARQMGQQQRLLDAAEVAAGQKAGNFNVARQVLIESRKAKASPLYESAFLEDIALNPELLSVLERPAMKAALNKAAKLAANEGDDVGENLLKKIHYAKMNLDDQIGAAVRAGSGNKARILTSLKNDLLAQVDELSPDYAEARQLFSTDSRMLNSMDEGLKLFTMSSDEMAETMAGMTPSEQDLFKLGAVRSIKDQLEKTGMTFDATRRLISTKSMRDKLGQIFPDPEDFIKKTLAEAEFSRTRQVLTGGSQTSGNLSGKEFLSDSIQPEVMAGLASLDPVAAGQAILSAFTKNKVTPQTVTELANMMLEQGVSPAQVRRVFETPAFKRSIGSAYDRVVVPAVAGAIAPAVSAGNR